jgi:hypothetical protein
MRIAGLSLLVLKAARQLLAKRFYAGKGWRLFFGLVLGGDAGSKPAIPPKKEKPARALPRSTKVSDAQYQLLSKRCQAKNAKYG